jgi:hypothetical protein
MRPTFLTGSASFVLAAVFVAGGSLCLVAQSARKPETGALAAKLAGQWQMNKELSADPSPASTPTAPSGPVTGGGIGGGYPGGGYGGGGMGGRGGGYGGGGFSRGAMSESVLRQRAILREASQPPDLVNVVVSKDVVTFTSNEGVVRKYTANGKKEKIDLTTAEVETVTSWTEDSLTQEMKSGDVKLNRTWQPTATNQLVVTVTLQTSTRLQPQVKKFVYDRTAAANLKVCPTY